MKSNLVEHVTMRINLENMNELAHTHSLMYNRELTITLVYKYKVKFKNRRVLIKVF